MCSGGQDLEIADVADLLQFAAQASYVVTLAGIPLRQMHQLSIGMHVARSYSLPVHACATRYIGRDLAFAREIAHPPCRSSQVAARLLLEALGPPRTCFSHLFKLVSTVRGLMGWTYILGARDRPPDPLR